MTAAASSGRPVRPVGTSAATETRDLVVIGAGFGGMYAVHRLRRDHDLVCFEAGDGVGGTWYWNRYPGARVDIESMEYSYSFDEALQQEWRWPEMFSPQADLEAYANHVADRFDLRRSIRFSTTVTAMHYDAQAQRWHVFTDRGDHVVCRFVVAATGALNAAYVPPWPGTDTFQGLSLHTARWPREGVDVTGKRVGVIGTGSTAIQAMPILAQSAAHLYVFQRTPAYSMPSGNRPLDPEYEREWKAHYAERRARALQSASGSLIQPSTRSVFDVTPEERERILEEAWQSRSGFQLLVAFGDIMTSAEANEIVSEFLRRKIRQIVKDPATAELLCPRTFPLGAKRVCIDSGNYYEMYNRDNVTLVDVRTNPIVEITPRGVRTTAAEYELDVIVYATGFDALTGAMTRIDVVGANGETIRERWRGGPRTYLGIMVSGFPNLFIVHGPQTPTSLAVMIMGAEAQVNWIARVLEDLRRDGYQAIDTTPEAEAQWGAEVDAAAQYTLHRTAESWYSGSNVEGKARGFMVYVGGFDRYMQRCNGAVDAGYEGFVRAR